MLLDSSKVRLCILMVVCCRGVVAQSPGPAPGPAPAPGILAGLTVARPTFVAADIVSAASLTPDLAPGMVIAIHGSFLSTGEAEAGALPLPTSLAGTQVLVNNVPIPLLLVSPELIHAQLPWEQAPGAFTLFVRSEGLESGRVSLTLRRAAPGIIVFDEGRAALQNADGRFNTDLAQATSGMQATLYAVGLGPVDARVVTGTASPVARTTLPVTMTFSGQRAEVVNATLMEGMISVYRIQVRIPEVGYGVHQVRVTVDGFGSNVGLVTVLPIRAPGGDNWCLQAPAQNGKVILPAGATEVEVVEEDFESGDVHALYPAANTGNDAWYRNLRNTSDGCPATVETGQVPLPPPDSDEERYADLIEDLGKSEEWIKEMEKAAAEASSLNFNPTDGEIVRIATGNFVYQRPADRCSAQAGQPLSGGAVARYCALLAESPFAGKDIIYVHGLNIDILKKALKGDILPSWASGSMGSSIYTTYFQGIADGYWQPHVTKFLVGRSAKNRYLTVGYSSAAHLQFAANTLLYQVARAMNIGEGVKLLDPADIRGTVGFCARGCIVISHSTGGPVTDVAMALAADATYRAQVGPIQYIYQNIAVHVAISGAFSGSKYAAIAVALGSGVADVKELGCRVVNFLLERDGADCDYEVLPKTLLMDLVPSRMHGVWGPWIGRTPVRTLTVAGGNHETMFPMKKWFLSGFDDGVLNMDSACARIMSPGLGPAGSWPSRASTQWDRGMARDGQLLRSFRFWNEQMGGIFSVPPERAAAGCTPYKTPWGMVFQPIWLLRNQPTTFYPNHYAFIQSAENHTGKLIWTQKDGLKGGETPELEDVRANGDDMIYTLNLVKTSLKTAQQEAIKGRAVRFKLFGKKHKIYLWKRTYHRLAGWQHLPTAEYIYRFVR